MTPQQKKDFKKVIIVAVIGAMIVLLIPMFFHSSLKGDTVESREALLDNVISGGNDWKIVKEKEVGGYIISCAYSVDGKSTIAVFKPASNGKYEFSTSTNRDNKDIIIGGALINGEWYDLVWFNGAQTEYAEIIYTVNGVSKEAIKYDTTDMDLICINKPEKEYSMEVCYYDSEETDMNKKRKIKI